MLAASLVANTNFWIFAILFGGFNGFFAGIAYQAPMHAVQLYFPDRKGTVSKILLLYTSMSKNNIPTILSNRLKFYKNFLMRKTNLMSYEA